MKKVLVAMFMLLFAASTFATSFCKGSIDNGYGDCTVLTSTSHKLSEGASTTRTYKCPSSHPYVFRIKDETSAWVSSSTFTSAWAPTKKITVIYSNFNTKKAGYDVD